MKNNAVLLALLLPCTSVFAASNSDTDFVTKAADAGMTEVATGKLAADKGHDSKTKMFGQQMVDDHGRANDELKAIATKDQIMLPADISAAHRTAKENLAKLDGVAFDSAYAKMAVADHEDAVALFKNEAATGTNPDLRSFAQKTLPTLEHHLDMSKQLSR
jgi:putative membrane protein